MTQTSNFKKSHRDGFSQRNPHIRSSMANKSFPYNDEYEDFDYSDEEMDFN